VSAWKPALDGPAAGSPPPRFGGPLDEAQPNERLRVVSVFERDRKLLEYLEGLGVRPGVILDVRLATTTRPSHCCVNGSR
jgi:hypothetical protein